MAGQARALFEDFCDIKELNPGGKPFDKVSRIVARSENYEMDIVLDVNSELYPLDVNQKVLLVLVKTLNLDGTPDTGAYDQTSRRTLADNYEYVMHGRVYKYDEDKSSTKVSVYISFGGLLMSLRGDARHVEGIDVGMNIYLLMRKAQHAGR